MNQIKLMSLGLLNKYLLSYICSFLDVCSLSYILNTFPYFERSEILSRSIVLRKSDGNCNLYSYLCAFDKFIHLITKLELDVEIKGLDEFFDTLAFQLRDADNVLSLETFILRFGQVPGEIQLSNLLNALRHCFDMGCFANLKVLQVHGVESNYSQCQLNFENVASKALLLQYFDGNLLLHSNFLTSGIVWQNLRILNIGILFNSFNENSNDYQFCSLFKKEHFPNVTALILKNFRGYWEFFDFITQLVSCWDEWEAEGAVDEYIFNSITDISIYYPDCPASEFISTSVMWNELLNSSSEKRILHSNALKLIRYERSKSYPVIFPKVERLSCLSPVDYHWFYLLGIAIPKQMELILLSDLYNEFTFNYFFRYVMQQCVWKIVSLLFFDGVFCSNQIFPIATASSELSIHPLPFLNRTELLWQLDTIPCCEVNVSSKITDYDFETEAEPQINQVIVPIVTGKLAALKKIQLTSQDLVVMQSPYVNIAEMLSKNCAELQVVRFLSQAKVDNSFLTCVFDCIMHFERCKMNLEKIEVLFLRNTPEMREGKRTLKEKCSKLSIVSIIDVIIVENINNYI